MSQFAKPLWTDPGQKSEISMCKLNSTLKRKKKRVGIKWSNLPPKSLQARKKLPPLSLPVGYYTGLHLPASLPQLVTTYPVQAPLPFVHWHKTVLSSLQGCGIITYDGRDAKKARLVVADWSVQVCLLKLKGYMINLDWKITLVAPTLTD